MNPQTTLLPLTYGIATTAGITCYLVAIASLVAVVAVAAPFGFRRLRLRPLLTAIAVTVWASSASSVAIGYRDGYLAINQNLVEQSPAPTEQQAAAALIIELQPSVWAIKMILLFLVGIAICITAARARSASMISAALSAIRQPAARITGTRWSADAPTVDDARVAVREGVPLMSRAPEQVVSRLAHRVVAPLRVSKRRR